MKKVVFLVLAIALLLCACSSANNAENESGLEQPQLDQAQAEVPPIQEASPAESTEAPVVVPEVLEENPQPDEPVAYEMRQSSDGEIIITDSQGGSTIVTDMVDSWIGGFYEDQIIVVKDENYGVINADGEIVIPAEYRDVSRLGSNAAIYKLTTFSISAWDFDLYTDYWIPNGFTHETPPAAYCIERFTIVDGAGGLLYDPECMVLTAPDYYGFRLYPYDNEKGCILAYDFDSMALEDVDINGYWGQPEYAALVPEPAGFHDGPIPWGQFSGEPIYQVKRWSADLPFMEIY